MPEAAFSIAYHGPSLVEGRMDVRDLAPALLALDALYRDARPLTTPDAPSVELAVSGVRAGSLVVDLNLIQIVADEMVDLLASRESTALTALMEYVAGTSGLLAFIKRLRARTFRPVDKSEGVIKVMAEGEGIEVPVAVLRLYDNVTVRRRAREVIAPLEAEGVTRMEVWRHSEMTVTLGEEDISFFEIPSPEIKALKPQAVLPKDVNEYEVETWLSVLSPAFDRHRKWRLSDSSGRFFSVRMADHDFLNRVESGDVEFRAGDALHCRMHIREKLRDGCLVSTTRTVVKVLDHRPRQSLDASSAT